MRIGVLSLQGSVAEHLACLSRLEGVEGVPVNTTAALAGVDGLILPGGESTTIGKLLRIFGLFQPLRQRIADGMPVWGTCAGMILLAHQVAGETPHLDAMDIVVRRNAYGRQLDSFATEVVIPAFGERALPLIFIRAPWIQEVGPAVQVLCELDGRIVAAQQEHLLVTSFHPELTDDLTVHAYFAALVRKARSAYSE